MNNNKYIFDKQALIYFKSLYRKIVKELISYCFISGNRKIYYLELDFLVKSLSTEAFIQNLNKFFKSYSGMNMVYIYREEYSAKCYCLCFIEHKKEFVVSNTAEFYVLKLAKLTSMKLSNEYFSKISKEFYTAKEGGRLLKNNFLLIKYAISDNCFNAFYDIFLHILLLQEIIEKKIADLE
jgi:hypothetical protein